MHTNNGSTAFSSLGSAFNRVDFINSSNKIRIRCRARPNNNNYNSIYLLKLLDGAHFISIPYHVLMQMRPSPTDEPTGIFHTLSALISRATISPSDQTININANDVNELIAVVVDVILSILSLRCSRRRPFYEKINTIFLALIGFNDECRAAPVNGDGIVIWFSLGIKLLIMRGLS